MIDASNIAERAVAELAVALARAATLHEICTQVLLQASRLTGSVTAIAAYLEPLTGQLEVLAARGANGIEHLADPRPAPWIAALWSRMGERPETLVINQAATDPGLATLPLGSQQAQRLLVSPVVAGQQAVGLLILAGAPHDYSPADVSKVEPLTAILALAADRERTLASLRRARAHATTLDEASNVLAASLDYETTLSSLAQLAVPGLADWVVVSILGEDDAIRQVVVAHADPGQADLARQIQRRLLPNPDAPYGLIPVLRSGQPALWPEVDEAWITSVARDAEAAALLRAMRMRSLAIVPLPVRGRVLGAISFASAESGRRYGPDDLELFHEIAHRAAFAIDSARLYREAQSAVRSRDEFFSLVSHDLRSPLVGIKGNAQLLLRRLARHGRLGPELAQDALERIDRTATRMALQIDELLDVARLRLGRPLALDRQPVDLVELARRAAEEHQATQAAHHIVFAALAGKLVGRWDTVRLERVLANLIGNAIKYTPAGGTITISVDQEESPEGCFAVLSVRDEGVGIPAADADRIFEPFQRADNAARRAGGAGLGLTSARLIVEQHGGTISVASVEGEGATFTVRLPLEQPPEQTVAPAG